ncbi:DUF7302 family protein [Actinokineospora enzanensis]|uniref:DUF7302 family protein n=1 Tax=Actinokineospora enzanensis TaxID=155975 RepID=UPI0003794198|nr:hypothetical protein [Actinokineospora enzanensis]
MELINTVGTRVHVREELAAQLIAAGYREPTGPTATAPDPAPSAAARRTTTRAKRVRGRGQ